MASFHSIILQSVYIKNTSIRTSNLFTVDIDLVPKITLLKCIYIKSRNVKKHLVFFKKLSYNLLDIKWCRLQIHSIKLT